MTDHAMILDEIVAYKKQEVAARIAIRPQREMAARAEHAPQRPGFREALSGPGMAFIAEIKGASPSMGVIRSDVDPVAIARAYEAGGAAALSVLTDARYFQGSWEALSLVSHSSELPVLCKEFVIDPYQIDEARAAGASAVLLIAVVLDGVQLRRFLDRARSRRLDALVEVHTAEEASVALDAGASIIGINNRDLKTLQVHSETTARLRPMIPPGVTVVSESGIETRAQIEQLERIGVDAILIGTSLMASPDPAAKLRELRGA